MSSYDHEDLLEDLVNTKIVSVGEKYRQQSRLMITDNNMLIEYKNYKKRPIGLAKLINFDSSRPLDTIYNTHKSWSTLFRNIGQSIRISQKKEQMEPTKIPLVDPWN